MRKIYTFLFITSLVGLMSAQTTVDFTLDEGYVQGFWKPETELVNGRLAMVGIASLLLTESIHPLVPLF